MSNSLQQAQKIIPNLWLEDQAEEAAHYYLSIFKDGKIINRSYYPKTAAEGLADFQKTLQARYSQ